ncbi:hypothetical protein BN946_scf184403.g16 [Trametes cinnabarina]|uniref:Uncharacterized protein n=1 Tax=Pycnoporus cinnabarinus TaxID=5643 RepID=A0A060SS88_PYCCI|nr:hypothetical protein BN946_scf184403.g16 [Trametes cinnabarina]
MAKKKLELPPALQTRASNRNRIVGAPDMPRPKRSHDEVIEEARQREGEAAIAQKKQQAAIARLASIEQQSDESTGIIHPRPQALARKNATASAADSPIAEAAITNPVAEDVQANRPLILRLRLPRRGTTAGSPKDNQPSAQGMQYPLARPAPCDFHSPAPEGLAGLISSNESSGDPLSESLLNIEDQEPSLEDIESGSSGDEYQPQNQDAEGESEMDDDSEAEDLTDVRPAQGRKNMKQTKPRRADVEAVKIVASQKASSAGGVGKRKPEETGTIRMQVAVVPTQCACTDKL